MYHSPSVAATATFCSVIAACLLLFATNRASDWLNIIAALTGQVRPPELRKNRTCLYMLVEHRKVAIAASAVA